MCKVNKYFRLAKEVAVKGPSIRQNLLGAVGVRTDGAIVKSNNLSCRFPTKEAHAEARVCRKLGWGGTVYVVRVLRDGTLTMAKPCRNCENRMRLSGVVKVYYSINENEFGVMTL
jgi:tRNA(Arg) A34 adenosine deaminase TadA